MYSPFADVWCVALLISYLPCGVFALWWLVALPGHTCAWLRLVVSIGVVALLFCRCSSVADVVMYGLGSAIGRPAVFSPRGAWLRFLVIFALVCSNWFRSVLLRWCFVGIHGLRSSWSMALVRQLSGPAVLSARGGWLRFRSYLH